MAHEIQGITNTLKDINEKARGFGLQARAALADIPQVLPPQAVPVNRGTDSRSIASNFVGREDDTSTLAKMLMSPADDAISIIPIQGMGGIGKTARARKVSNDQQIQGHFNKQIWTCVSDLNFQVTSLFDLILESLTRKRPEADRREAKAKSIQRELEGQKYRFASWIGKLDNLTGLSLQICKRLKDLPPLGQLPSLQDLTIDGLDGITSIGLSFYGCGGGQVAKYLFPKLKCLKPRDMPNLAEWTDAEATVMSTSGHPVAVFPILELLEIYYCPLLTTAPSHFPGLKELRLSSLTMAQP